LKFKLLKGQQKELVSVRMPSEQSKENSFQSAERLRKFIGSYNHSSNPVVSVAFFFGSIHWMVALLKRIL
jgi:hypothetical protein